MNRSGISACSTSLDRLGLGHGNDRRDAAAPTRDVGDPAADGGFVQDLGQLGAQFADTELGACVRRHTPMVAVVHSGTLVYTDGGVTEPP